MIGRLAELLNESTLPVDLQGLGIIWPSTNSKGVNQTVYSTVPHDDVSLHVSAWIPSSKEAPTAGESRREACFARDRRDLQTPLN